MDSDPSISSITQPHATCRGGKNNHYVCTETWGKLSRHTPQSVLVKSSDMLQPQQGLAAFTNMKTLKHTCKIYS
ncbi:hypothetical protein M8J77_011582 [Diaphorina citri]|nr:hypothetical protein M8J77_011582 [Diaphorina citri]